ncbi:MAG: tRNA uridine-5-carboxymethylaminomethyl(34) synthesis GTPase MnmE [Kiritimatiellae bacterium]|nr:tRNA uridine-5-carboxymethylaminomethyl(34) synthesis GTPase MnmE [Kiritimatiellia bacterium]
MNESRETIAAIATAAGAAGVSVVRVSGPGSFRVADRLLPPGVRSISRRQTGSFFHTHVRHPETGETVDDAVVLVFRAPHSYTGEDSVELQGHGGTVPSRRLLDAVLAAGARLAGPGEFTRRAFLNGKLDLTQAEAVADFIAAKSDAAAGVARAQLDGSLGDFLGGIYDELLSLSADAEHALDFSEDELPDGWLRERAGNAETLAVKLRRKVDSWREGRVLAEGALVVLSGKPNAGKSSLMNALLGTRRSIVNERPGTTRDAIEESLSIHGVTVRLVDTAGLREVDDEIEAEGVALARSFVERADLNLRLVDPFVSGSVEKEPSEANVKTLTVWTKADLGTPHSVKPPDVFAVSARTGQGIEELKEAIIRAVGVDPERFDQPIVSLRQREELKEAASAAQDAAGHLRFGADRLVLAASRLRVATEAIGRILGRTYTEDLLDRVFSRFCVGK